MSQTTLPSASQEPGADGVRIKRLERELAESRSLHAKALDDIDGYEVEKQRLNTNIARRDADMQRILATKDRMAAELNAGNLPKVSRNETDEEVVKQLQARILELENTIITRNNDIMVAARKYWGAVVHVIDNTVYQNFKRVSDAREQDAEEIKKFREQNRELRGRIQMLERRLPRVLSDAEQYHVGAESSAKYVANQARNLRNIGSRLDRAAEMLENNPCALPNAVELLAKLREDCILEPSDFELPAETATPATKLEKVCPERLPRSSAETELLRLKDRRTLSRLGPF